MFVIVWWPSNGFVFCVDAVVDNYRSIAPVLSTHVGVKNSRCLILCVQNTPCKTLNYRVADGLCKLLPNPQCCMPLNVTNGTVYVELNTCGEYPPQKAFSPSTGNWKWDSDTSNLGDAVLLAGNTSAELLKEVCICLDGWDPTVTEFYVPIQETPGVLAPNMARYCSFLQMVTSLQIT